MEKMWFSTRPSVHMGDPFFYKEDFNLGQPGDALDNSILENPGFFSVSNPGEVYPGGIKLPWIRSNDSIAGGQERTTVKSPTGLTAGQAAVLDFKFTVPTYIRVINLKYVYHLGNQAGLQVYVNGELLYDHKVGDPGYTAWGQYVVDISSRITPGQETIVSFVHYKKSDTVEEATIMLDSIEIQHNGVVYNNPGEELISFDGSSGYELMYHRMGALAPPIEYLEYRIPFEPGSFPLHMDIQPRNIELGIRVMGTDRADLYRKIATLRSKLIGVDGALYHQTGQGKRLVHCRYIEGLEGEEKPDTMGAGYFMHLVLVFRCFDPFFYGESAYVAGTATYRFPLTNTGDTTIWPVIQIKGPATTPIYLYCYPDSETKPAIPTMQINTSIPAGKTLTIDGRPGRKTIKLDDGTNIYSYLHDQYRAFLSIPNDGKRYFIDLDCNDARNDREIFWLCFYQRAHWGIY